jgi:hypothetical protein
MLYLIFQYVKYIIIRPVVSTSALAWFIKDTFYRYLQLLNHVNIIKTKALLTQT